MAVCLHRSVSTHNCSCSVFHLYKEIWKTFAYEALRDRQLQAIAYPDEQNMHENVTPS